MRLTLGKKLLFWILGTNALVIALVALLAQWNLKRDFNQFLLDQEAAPLPAVSARLGLLYERAGGFEPILGRRAWRRVVSAVARGYVEAIDLYETFDDPLTRRPRGLPRTPDRGAIDGRPRGRRGAPRHLAGPDAIGPRLSLLDAERKVLMGPLVDNHVLSVDEPIRAGDAVVGWLTLRAFDGTANALATHYAKKQVRTLWIVALVAFVVASAVSIGLARHLVGRVKPIAHGARRLADGHWEMRVSVAGNDELSDLSEDFNRLAKTLSETEEARKQWVADIAHELRTPLSVLRAQVEAIQDGVRANTSETFQTLHDEVRHLTRLVDDLYQLSMSDLGALDYHMVQLDWGDLVRNAADQFAPRFEAADLRLVVQLDSPPITLSGDRQRLDQLLSNLFENSLRYTDPGGRVEVKLRADPRSVALTICDSAPGVDAEHAARLFERLYRVEASRSRRFGGSGLGLSICRNIVEAHQGSIVARSSPLGGLEITVTLPA